MSFTQVGDSKTKAVEDITQVCGRTGYWKGTDLFSGLKFSSSVLL